MLFSYLIRIVLRIRNVNQYDLGPVSKAFFAGIPLFLLLMWFDNSISTNEKVINTSIGAVCVAEAFGLLVLEKRKNK